MAAPNESTPVLDGSPSRSPRSTPASPGGAGGITFGSLLGHSFVDPWGAIAQIGLLVFFVTITIVLVQNPAGLFTYHPAFQTVAIIAFTQGVLLLQPTTSLVAKQKGLILHQVFQLTALPLLITGSSFIIYNKIIHSAKHFQSWHGLFGAITLSIILIQIIFGASIVYTPLQSLIGGSDSAKKLWKFHRISGYVTSGLLFLTPFTALSSDWIVGHTSLFQRVALGGGLVAAALGVLGRIRFSKLGFRTVRN